MHVWKGASEAPRTHFRACKISWGTPPDPSHTIRAPLFVLALGPNNPLGSPDIHALLILFHFETHWGQYWQVFPHFQQYSSNNLAIYRHMCLCIQQKLCATFSYWEYLNAITGRVVDSYISHDFTDRSVKFVYSCVKVIKNINLMWHAIYFALVYLTPASLQPHSSLTPSLTHRFPSCGENLGTRLSHDIKHDSAEVKVLH